MKKFWIALFCFSLQIASAQSISKLNDEIVSLYLKAFNKNEIKQQDIELVKNELNQFIRPNNENMFLSEDDVSTLLQDFGKNITTFLQEDNCYKPLYSFYMKFISAINEDYKQKLSLTNKKKLLLLTTSVSCECTMTLCYKHLAELIPISLQDKSQFELIIEDTWNKTLLKDVYKVGFIPTVIILDKNNNEIKRLVRGSSLADEIININ